MKKMNNKGFSLIELIIVIAIMAILVAIIAPNLTKYLSKSKKNTDKKNADEIASQIQTCISDYESEDGGAYGTVGACTIEWKESGATTTNATFQSYLNAAITSSTKSKEDGTYAKATISLKGTDATDGYKVVVTVGNATASK